MNKTALILSITGILAYSIPAMPVKAITTDSEQVFTDEIQPYSAGLIVNSRLSVYADNGKLCINGYTISNDTMKSIGFKNIKIEYSSDNSNWSKEKSLSDLLNSSSSSYYLNNYSVSVKGGYYYRVTLKHYAKESGWFGSSQSMENTSNSVWVNS